VGRDSSDKSLDETINEIMIDRGMQPQSKGVVHWSISSLTKNTRLADSLLRSVYRKQALVPASPWLDSKAPAAPKVTQSLQGDMYTVNWTANDPKDVFHYVVYYQYGTKWEYKILNATDQSYSLKRSSGTNMPAVLNNVIVTAVDRVGNESELKQVRISN
jgi:hypothetical protein